MYKSLLVAAALTVGAAAASADDGATIAPAPAAIVIQNFEFSPSVLTVAPGTTVTWMNEDDSPHTIADNGKMFRSAALDTSDRFSYTFTAPGEFTYHCTMHPMMVGKIVVKPVATPGGSSS
jgi:plastocyanin